MKKNKILGAFNFLVLRLAYEYPLRGYFEEAGEKGLSYMYAFNSFKEKQGGILKKSPTERFADFNQTNDFGYRKLNLLLFLVITAKNKNKKFFFDLFTNFEADFYFKPVSYGIINQGISEYLKNTDADLLFETNTYFTTIKEVFITKEDICKSILDRFFVDKKEGEELLLKIEENITAINEKIFCFVNKLASVYTYHATNTLSFKLFIPDSEKWTEKDLKYFYEIASTETFSYQIESLM